jgi:beta-mannosidase
MARWLTPTRRMGYSVLEWLPASVPGHVHTDLVRHGIIADPFERMAELGCQWVDEEDFVYRTSFDFKADAKLPKRLVRFEGLDTVASVTLNGELVAEHENMFVPLEIDVSERLRDGKNELEVRFASAARVGRERRERYFASEGLANDTLRFDERAFVRKAQYMFGWDWGPRLASVGLWRPVSLVEHAGRLRDVEARQEHRSDGSVALTFFSLIDGAGEVVHFVEGESKGVRDGETLVLEKPKLWWPAGLGTQSLVQVTSVLGARALPTRAEMEGSALDRRRTHLGLRTLRLVREDDDAGQSFEFEVNGKRFYCVGANWIPDHSFPSSITRARLREQLLRARDMNMNMLRVWGGGLYETDEFYETCDELGLLVWQDFPYACSYYPEDDASLALARREAEENVRRLRHHPSLAIWCGNNENLTMFEEGWEDRARHPKRYYGERIYEGVLPEVLAKLDPTRPYVPTSPWGGPRANGGGIGDQHYWDVWHGRGDWKHYDDSTGRFASEFGFASAPSHASLKRFSPHASEPLALPVRDRGARWHDKTLKGYETFIGYVELHYPASKTLEEWSYYSQLNQRDALRHGIEHFRRSELCKGSLIWQLNDCWPVQSWAVLDFDAAYKAAAYELRRLYAPALASLVVAEGRARVTVVLDNAREAFHGDAVLEAHSLLDGKSVGRFAASVELAPGERRQVLDVDVSAFARNETILCVSFAGTQTFRLLGEPKDARLAEPRLTASVVSGGLAVESDVPVVDLFVWDRDGGLELADNFVTLPAAGRALLRTRGKPGRLAARSLAGVHALELR